jgi:non-specific serine/threonine protein kinase/serine/threonine-protein kinase
MTPERWKHVKQALATALELAPAERMVYLQNSYAADASLRADIEPLLASEQRLKEKFLDRADLAAAVATVASPDENFWVGRRVGPYSVVEQIGSGGMGEVYRAVRADDQYEKVVALKFVRAGQYSSDVLTRFKKERQILAGIDHPNLAKLLDGGTSDEGMPYFVMELIDGQPITQYCNDHELSIRERLKLFLQVCAAVHYAHQRLIIHRDIKPGNILVTADGIPKLLDFGIAKIVESGENDGMSDATLTGFRILTPRYASPEQIKGEAMTIATDVYSLGVVLYEVLTGRSPYEFVNGSTTEFAQEVCKKEPQKPSLAVLRSPGERDRSPAERSVLREISAEKRSKQLRGDIDNIVLMALRKEPSRRYASANDLREDIRRHLENIPVRARNDSVWYRTTKFAIRHKAAVAASIFVVLAMMTALIITLHEARVARIERARAERRFNDVRKLANSLMFEVHDSIRDLPGTLPARKLLINRALEYLDSLSQEASGDTTLQRELASAYDRVGDLLGYTGAANLGDYAGALQSYEKALSIRESSAAAHPDDRQMQLELLNDYFRLSFALQDTGAFAKALTHLQKGSTLAQRSADAHHEPIFKDFLAGFYWQTANVLMQSGDYRNALEKYRQGASIREALMENGNATSLVRTHLAADYIGLGKAMSAIGDLNGAVQYSRKGAEILEQLSSSDPNNATLQEYLGEAYDRVAAILLKRNELDQCLTYYIKGLKVFAKLSSADPANSLARDNAGLMEVGIGDALIQESKISAALPHIRNAITNFEKVEHKNRYQVVGQASAYDAMARAMFVLAGQDISISQKVEHLQRSKFWYEKSLNTFREEPGLQSVDPLGGDVTEESVKQELSKCEESLAKLAVR